MIERGVKGDTESELQRSKMNEGGCRTKQTQTQNNKAYTYTDVHSHKYVDTLTYTNIAHRNKYTHASYTQIFAR